MASEHHRDSGAAYSRRSGTRPPVVDKKCGERAGSGSCRRQYDESADSG